MDSIGKTREIPPKCHLVLFCSQNNVISPIDVLTSNHGVKHWHLGSFLRSGTMTGMVCCPKWVQRTSIIINQGTGSFGDTGGIEDGPVNDYNQDQRKVSPHRRRSILRKPRKLRERIQKTLWTRMSRVATSQRSSNSRTTLRKRNWLLGWPQPQHQRKWKKVTPYYIETQTLHLTDDLVLFKNSQGSQPDFFYYGIKKQLFFVFLNKFCVLF